MKVLVLLILVCGAVAKLRSGRVNGYEIEEKNVPNHKPRIHKYKPDWNDLDTRPLPRWYDAAKIGIFLHWGVYSVPGFGSEWFWSNWEGGSKKIIEFMSKNYPPGFTYQEFAPMFTAEFFNPDKWASLFAKAGAKYIVLTSKHHEGFTLFPSKHSFSWNAGDIGPKKDLVKMLSEAVRKSGMKFGVYHSLYEWYNPIYLEDKKTNFTTSIFPDTKLWPDIKQLVNDYQPSVLWADGDWEAYDKYWKSTELLAWLYNDSPVKDEIVVNDRWGIDTYCKHGDFYNCQDRYNPGHLMNHKWENAFTIDKSSWGYRRNIDIGEILTINELLQNVVSTVSCGGNALINVGPTKEGTIAPIFQERLLQLGEWLEVNGEAIYETSPWQHQNDSLNSDVWYTCKKAEYNAFAPTTKPIASDTITAVYAIFLKWPKDNLLKVNDLANFLHKGTFQIDLLGPDGHKGLKWEITKGVVEITLPEKSSVSSMYAWALRLTSSSHP